MCVRERQRQREYPSLMPRLFLMKSCFCIFFLTCGLCRSVFSMITANASTYTASAAHSKREIQNIYREREKQ